MRCSGWPRSCSPDGPSARPTETNLTPLTFHLIPHTHWDREWYLPHRALLGPLVSAFDDLLDRLETEPGFRGFLLDGQTVLVEDYLAVRPENAGRVEELVRRGRLQVGPWYVLADELIPSGESLVRNLLLGLADSERLGRRLDVLYSPDAFGHPAAWPTLAAEFGLSYGVLWRGLGGRPGQRGDWYRYRGPDGQSVLLYHLPPAGYEIGVELPADRTLLPRAWTRIRSELVRRASTSHVAVFVGADHHSAHPAVGRLRDRLAELEPDNQVRVSRLDEFCAAAGAEAPDPVEISGELRWSYGYTWTLQGVHGSRASLKRRHGEAELWLERVAEPLAALAETARSLDHRPLLRHGWRTLIRSQFHDSLAGCTSDAVARRVETRLEDAELIARGVARASLHALVGHDPDAIREQDASVAPALMLWNPVARARGGAGGGGGVVIADTTWFRRDVLVGPAGGRTPRVGEGFPSAGFALRGPAGDVPVQVLGRRRAQERLDAAHHYPDQDEVDVVRIAFLAPEMGGFGLAALSPVAGAGPAKPAAVRAGPDRVDNGLVEVTVGRGGSIHLLDRRTGQRFDHLLGLESGGDAGDTYSYSPPTNDRVRSAGPLRARLVARGPLVGALELRGRITRRSGVVGVRLVLTLHAGSAVLRCTLEIDNQALHHRLRLRCPTGLAGKPAVAGAAFGSVTRQPVPAEDGAHPMETPVPTAPAQRFLARAQADRGLAILAPGFFEYENEAGGDLLVTVLRAVGQLSRGDLPTRPGHAGWPTPTPGAQCLVRERMQLGVAAVTAADLEDGTVLPHLWEDVFLPPRAVWLRRAAPPPLGPAPIDLRLAGPGLIFSSLKPAEQDGATILRCFNARSTDAEGCWRLPRRALRACQVRADERSPVPLTLEDSGRLVRFRAGGRRLVTVLVEWSPD